MGTNGANRSGLFAVASNAIAIATTSSKTVVAVVAGARALGVVQTRERA